MFVKTQFNEVLVNLDNVESITTERPEEHTAIIYAQTPQGTRYNLATAANRQEAREIIGALLNALAEDCRAFNLQKYTADQAERRAFEKRSEARAAETRRKYHREHWAETQGRKAKKSDNGGALDWTEPEEVTRPPAWDNEIAESAAAGNLDIIRCNYPEGAPGVIVTQTGAEIAEPADWQKIYIEPTPQGDMVITLEYYSLDNLGDPSWDIIGIYPPDRINQVFRDLRAAIENQRERILLPKK